MKDGETAGGAGPGGVHGANALEADEAREGAGAGGSEERLDLYEIMLMLIAPSSGEVEVGFENGGREVGVAVGGVGPGVGIGVGGKRMMIGGGTHFKNPNLRQTKSETFVTSVLEISISLLL